MQRKHAIVIALSFVLVATMFCAVDTPLIVNQPAPLQNMLMRQDMTEISDEPDSMGNMLTDVMENPSFENWAGNFPDSYSNGYASTYVDAVFDYSGTGVTGSYGLLIESESSTTNGGGGYVDSDLLTTYAPVIEPGMYLTLDWNVLDNPVFNDGGYVYVEVITYDDVSKHRNFFYILSRNAAINNGSIDAWFYLDDTIGDWHSLSRNITEDYISVWGEADLNSNQYIQAFRLRTYSYEDDVGIIQVAFDNVRLTNGTYSSWIRNGDFEMGTETYWSASRSSKGYLEQSTDSTHETYSMNMSIPEYQSASGAVNVYKDFTYPASYFASSADSMYFDIDWKYNDTPVVPNSQWSYLAVTFRNTTGYYWLYILFGTQNDLLWGSNVTSSFFFKMPGFGIRDTWQHSRLDMYDYVSSVGISNVSLTQVQFYLSNSGPGASVFLLVDNFQIVTYPFGDPGFEEDWYNSVMTPFAGWAQYGGETGVMSRSTDALIGNYACNFTVQNLDSVAVFRDVYLPLHLSDLTNFTWRLDEGASSNAYAQIEIWLSNGNQLNYVLAAGSSHSLGNTSNIHNIVPTSFNETGSWNHLVANLTKDVTEAFGYWSGVYVNRLILNAFCPASQRLSILFDEMHIVDGAPPVIDTIDFLPALPMYYETVDVTVYTHDDRTGIQLVYVDYYNGSWFSLSASDMGGYYVATIPAQSYGTNVEFQVSVFDGCYNNAFDNNGGARYSYTVDDDVDPNLFITNPVNNTDQSGLLVITAAASDLGSGIEYVTFNPDGAGPINDYTAPYSQNWDLDDESLGSHFIDVTARDNAGNEVTLTHYITVIDEIAPGVSFTSPAYFEEVEGQVSVVIDAVDDGAGVAFVELYIASGVTMSLVMNDTVAPYEYTWNTDLEDLGDYTLYAHVVDNVGLSNGAIVNVTVVDTIAPELNSPANIEFTVGETGYTIDWDPTDVRPYGYVVYLDGEFHQFNSWNSSSEHIVINLDGLAVGIYNFTCVVVDGTINGAIDTVIVTVNAETTSTTTATTTTETTTTDTTSATGGTTDGGGTMILLIVVAAVGVVGVLLVVFVVLPKMKAK